MAYRRTPSHPRPGVHFLRSPAIAAGLVASAGIGPGSIVLDLGAGGGAITAPLARTGALVLAIERDPSFVERLRARFDGQDRVRVVAADALTVPLPRRRFDVVASIPFAISTPLLRRLLRPGSRLAGADVIVEWGLARRLTEPSPRNPEIAGWAVDHELRLVRRVAATSFEPAPAVDAAHLAVRPRRLTQDDRRTALALLRAAHRAPRSPARTVLRQVTGRGRPSRLLVASGIDPPAPAATVPVAAWVEIALGRDRAVADR